MKTAKPLRLNHNMTKTVHVFLMRDTSSFIPKYLIIIPQSDVIHYKKHVHCSLRLMACKHMFTILI